MYFDGVLIENAIQVALHSARLVRLPIYKAYFWVYSAYHSIAYQPNHNFLQRG